MLVLVSAYTFMTVLHIFYLPHYTADRNTPAYILNLKQGKPSDNKSTLPHTKRTDKVTTNEKRSFLPEVAELVPLILLLIIVFGAFSSLKPRYVRPAYLLVNKQYSYLHFCAIRI